MTKFFNAVNEDVRAQKDALDGVDICINWSNMVNLSLNDNLTALRQSVKFGVHDLRKFFLFFICYSREC